MGIERCRITLIPGRRIPARATYRSNSAGRSDPWTGLGVTETVVPHPPDSGLEVFGAEGGVAGLDQAVDDAEALVEGPEGRLHGVDGEPLQLVPAVAEGVDELVQLLGEGDRRHQAVVGVDGVPEPQPGEQADGVLGHRV